MAATCSGRIAAARKCNPSDLLKYILERGQFSDHRALKNVFFHMTLPDERVNSTSSAPTMLADRGADTSASRCNHPARTPARCGARAQASGVSIRSRRRRWRQLLRLFVYVTGSLYRRRRFFREIQKRLHSRIGPGCLRQIILPLTFDPQPSSVNS
jgi:hypothetical protein